MSITAHCIVKNEEHFVGYALRSVLPSVEKVIVFDTGSTDATCAVIRGIAAEFPGKVVFEEKGPCGKARHTELRQEMLDRTATDWWMIVDGDEVWTKRAIDEARAASTGTAADCLFAPFHLCVGDIFHEYRRRGAYEVLGRRGNYALRFMRRIPGVRWDGAYGEDALKDASGSIFSTEKNSLFLKNAFWHLTHLTRSSADDLDYSSGGSRAMKRRLTYFLIGKRIAEPLPEVFSGEGRRMRISPFRSFVSFFRLILFKMHFISHA